MRRCFWVLSFLFINSMAFAQSAPIRHTLEVNGNKLALWEKRPEHPTKAILLLHGRTYSSLPDFDLQVKGANNYSMMDALVSKGYAVYALDQPGYGESPRDKSGWFTPKMGVENAAAALRYIQENNHFVKKPALFGWSLGSTMALYTAQQHPDLLSDVVIFGYWRDLDVPIADDATVKRITGNGQIVRARNTPEQAGEDFVAPKSVVKEAKDAFVEKALKSDPIKTDIRDMEEFGKISPKDISAPVLVMQGEYDSGSSTDKNAKLFTRLANPDRQWVIIAGGDHGAFLEKTKDAFVAAMLAFLERPHF